MNEMNVPGFLVYIAKVQNILPLLTIEDTGRLFKAMVDFADAGQEPGFEPQSPLHLVWPFFRGDIELDKSHYFLKVAHSRYAAYCKTVKNKGEEKLTFPQWLQTPAGEPYREFAQRNASLVSRMEQDLELGQ